MKIKINIGKSQLEFEGKDYKEAVKEAAAFSQCTKCSLCKGTNVALNYRSAVAKQGKNVGQAFDYYEIKCMDCFGSVQLGEYKAGGWFAKKWEKYEAQGQSNNAPTPSDDLDNPGHDVENDAPF